ncbi:uncharacterized protein LOC133180568 [Saccostrea echinata]|uniref:uncharacterized protein LOC133180568 n=1 Tax=Saccostrea echinata TaxID=191078 RepID=UPI002A82791A|nr:uncharacterized protein LOC133180568 [Saccostrea echinata]
MELDPTGKERLDRISRLVFDRRNLQTLREGICSLFDIYHDILEKEFEYGCYFNNDDIIARLDEVKQNSWDDIREHFIEDDYHSYSKGNFTDDEVRDPAKLVLDLINQVIKCKEGVYQKLEQKHTEIEEAERRVDEYREKAQHAYETLMNERKETTDRLLEAAKTKTKLKCMEQLYEEKSQKLQELQRTSTVCMWEREREKVVKDYQQKIEDLENEISFLKQNTRSISRRMSNIDDQNKMFKMRQERSKSFQDETVPDVDSLKRDIYVREKDISHLEGELYDQQKLFMGMVAGLKTDISKLSEHFYDEETCERDPEFVKLLKNVTKIYDALAEGTLQQSKLLMPPHYTFHDKEVKIKRVRRLSKANALPRLSLSGFSNDPLPDIRTNGNGSTGEENSSSDPSKLQTLEENPVIVDPKTNKMNGIVYLRHFAHMSQKFILEHWAKFREYDKNGDQSLDVNEVSELLQSLGLKALHTQIEEAMDEVDIDKSHSLDFYEYLLVVDKITKKSGKAALFRNGISKPEGTKVCVIQ